MTISSPVHRGSADDDDLDQQLNDWVSGNHRQHHSEPVEESQREAQQTTSLAAESLDFHRWAEETLRTDPAATGPAASTWNRVLRSSAQASPKGTREMSSATLSSQATGYAEAQPASVGQSIRRYSNLVATIALVLAITIGGWLAMSQLPGGGGRFAALQGTPEAAQAQTCDVEPLTVDEVIAIVENPFSTIDQGWWGTPETQTPSGTLQDMKLFEAPNLWFELGLYEVDVDRALQVPDDELFGETSVVANQMLDCLTGDATMGQLWAIMEPTSVQAQILSNFPVYRDRAEMRTFVEDRIDERSGSEYDYMQTQDDLVITTNPRRGDARIRVSDERGYWMDYETQVFIGWQGTDADGNVVFADDWAGTTVEGDPSRSNGTSIVLVRSESTGKWYYVSFYGTRG